jgi:S-adenosylmethionine:tRNA ribosyltransferase-isomerase
MRTDDFDFELPIEQVAQQPLPRGTSRLMVLSRSKGSVEHRAINALPELLRDGDLVLLNDTRVIPARLRAHRATGRTFELLLLRRISDAVWESLLRPSARARQGERLLLDDGGEVIPVDNLGEARWRVEFRPPLELSRLDGLGEVPLPPYIERDESRAEDRQDYQTVYASNPGAVAAPTAGLHLTEELLDDIRGNGVELAFLTLHVGLGTFRPVQAEEIADHRMHREWFHIPETTAESVNRALAAGRRIVCVGTTSVRALEGALAASDGALEPSHGWTDLYITPGYQFRGVGAMLTNFHLPKSTLLMLVSAFAGRERMLAAYAEAVEQGYRFFSYGDAMFIE